MLKLKTLAAATAAAIGLAAVTSTPAQADNGDIARFLAGAAAIAIIVDATNRNQNRHRVEKRYVYVPAPRPHRHRREVIVQRRTVTVVRPGDRHDRWDRHDRRANRRDHRQDNRTAWWRDKGHEYGGH